MIKVNKATIERHVREEGIVKCTILPSGISKHSAESWSHISHNIIIFKDSKDNRTYLANSKGLFRLDVFLKEFKEKYCNPHYGMAVKYWM